jgi:hypothetical protein
MTNEELEHIQTVCRGWLRQSDTANGSRMTIPAGGALSRTVEVGVTSLLTFDNVLILSAVDAETGTCYTKLIGQHGTPGAFIDTPLDRITAKPATPEQIPPAAMRATQKRYREAMKTRPDGSEVVSAGSETNTSWIQTRDLEAEQLPKYLLYTNQQLLGYSLLERARSDAQRSGRFHPGEDYFEYAGVFEAFPEAENECLEANVREAYEIFDEKNEEYRSRFNELSARIAMLNLYVADEAGNRIEAAEVRLEDLSRHYDDQMERWLYVTLEPNLWTRFTRF